MAKASKHCGTKIMASTSGSNKMNKKHREEIHQASHLAFQLRHILSSLCFAQFEKTHFNIDTSDYDSPNELEAEKDASRALAILDEMDGAIENLICWDLELDGAL
jgi:hypothetical protein